MQIIPKYFVKELSICLKKDVGTYRLTAFVAALQFFGKGGGALH